MLRAILAFACGAGVVVSLMARDARIGTEDALRYYFATRDPQGTLKRFDDARLLNPAFGIDVARANLQPGKALAILRRAIAREPENAELWLRLAQRQVVEGDRAGAQRSYARARSLAPAFLPRDGPPPG